MSSTFVCTGCTKTYSNKGNLNKHINEGRCRGTPPVSIQTSQPQSQSQPFTPNQLTQLTTAVVTALSSLRGASPVDRDVQPSMVNNNHFNQNLNVVCLTPKDDLLGILTKKTDLKQALTYIKNCALSSLNGDYRLIQKIYIDIEKPVLMYGNKSKTQFVYYDENHNRVVETNAKVIAKMLAENVQRAYLKGSNSLKDQEGNIIFVKSDHPYLPVLDPHDITMWNDHIYELNDEKFQRKILNSLKIPFEGESRD